MFCSIFTSHSIHLNLHSIFYNQVWLWCFTETQSLTPEHAREKSGLIGRNLEQGQKKGGRQNWSVLINCRGKTTILWTLWMSRLCMRDCQWCPFSKSFLWRVTDTFWHHLSSSSITPCCQYITPTSLISLFLLNALLSNITALFILAWGKDRGGGVRWGGGYSSWYHTHSTPLPVIWQELLHGRFLSAQTAGPPAQILSDFSLQLGIFFGGG